MAGSWAMSKYRQIGFLMEAGADVGPNDYQNDPKKIEDMLQKGVVYKDKKKKYWVDGGRDCFAIYARGLHITNSDRRVYWEWLTKDGDSNGTEMARVLRTRWLEVRGSFWTMNLSPNTLYKVTFWTKVETWGNISKQTVNLRLTLPDGTTQQRQVELPPNDGQWRELEAGQFNMTAQNVGKMDFAMEQLFGRWRTGLVIWRVDIKAV